MRIDIPFYKQTTKLNCGPTSLKMALAYFGDTKDIEILEEKTNIKEGKGVSTIQLAIAAASLGYNVKFYSKHVLFNEENMKYEFYQKYGDDNLERSKRMVNIARENRVTINEKELSLNEVLKFLTKDSVPIVLLDWNLVKSNPEKSYQGHFVPIVGYDKENVYIHNPGLKETQEFMQISKRTFDKARKADGTDEDLLIISPM